MLREVTRPFEVVAIVYRYSPSVSTAVLHLVFLALTESDSTEVCSKYSEKVHLLIVLVSPCVTRLQCMQADASEKPSYR